MEKSLNRVLIVDKCDPLLEAGLRKEGFLVIEAAHLSNEELEAEWTSCEILVIRSRFKLTAEKLASSPELKIIARLGSGMDNIDEAAALQRGILCLNAADGNCDAVAEHVIGMIIGFSKNIVRADSQVRRFEWDREGNRGFELGGKTLGIIGYGHVGQALSRKISGFGMRVLAYDKYRIDYSDEFARETDLNELLAEADILSLHIPLTDESREMVKEEFILRCAKKPLLVNAARGEIVHLPSLIDAIEKGRLMGACLDVLPQEKFDLLQKNDRHNYERLFSLPMLVLSPHVAGWSREAERKMAESLLKKILTNRK